MSWKFKKEYTFAFFDSFEFFFWSFLLVTKTIFGYNFAEVCIRCLCVCFEEYNAKGLEDTFCVLFFIFQAIETIFILPFGFMDTKT